MSTHGKRTTWIVIGLALLASPPARGENYAVLFSGGDSAYYNWDRYYNNTLRVWNLLTGTLAYKPENVWVVFADGTDPGLDQHIDGGGYVNSDWSGVVSAGSTVLPATSANLQNTMANLTAGPMDLAFLWTFDHGSGTRFNPDVTGEEKLTGWGTGQDIPDESLAAWVDNWVGNLLIGRQAFVFGQCFSGGMLDDLDIAGRRHGCAATNHYEWSWGDGFVDAWADGVSLPDRTTTTGLYQYAYEHDPYATDGEGPAGTPTSGSVEHPWQVGATIDLAVAKWIGSGAGGSSHYWNGYSNWTYFPNGQCTTRVQFTSSGELWVDGLNCCGGYVSVDYAASVGSDAYLYLKDFGRLFATHEVVGDKEYGRVVHEDDAQNLNTGDLVLGRRPGSEGVYDFRGGTLTANTIHVGWEGTGRVDQSGGTCTVSNHVFLGSATGGVGTYTMTGGTLNVANGTVFVGGGGNGTFRLNGGTVVANVFYVLPMRGTFTTSGTAGTLRVNSLALAGGHHSFSGSFHVGHSGGSGSGAYTVPGGGSLSVGKDLIVGYDAPATFTQNSAGSAVTVADTLCLGHLGTGNGTYNLSAGSLSATTIYVGHDGTGRLNWTGGTVDADTINVGTGGRIDLNHSWAYDGTLNLDGGTVDLQWGNGLTLDATGAAATLNMTGSSAWLDCEDLYVGRDRRGAVVQDAGQCTINTGLYIGMMAGSVGSYELSGWQARCDRTLVGYSGTGTFTQTGGTHAATFEVTLGSNAGACGTYNLSGGKLETRYLNVGQNGHGEFNWTGGTLDLDRITVAADGIMTVGMNWAWADELNIHGGAVDLGSNDLRLGGGGPYVGAEVNMTGGSLSAGLERIGDPAYGRVIQSGGDNVAEIGVQIGCSMTGKGSYTISGGSLTTPCLFVGTDYAAGSFEIADPAAEVTVTDTLMFGEQGAFKAAPGSEIHLGADVEIHSTDTTALAGLGNVTLVFEGGSETVDQLEVAGRDLGPVPTGWGNNFPLAGLTLGGSDVGRIRLIDSYDNQQNGPGDEALYVGQLVLNAGASIDCNGRSLYFLNGGAPKELFRGDANLDGDVSYLDLGILATHYGLTGSWSQADFNGDWMVNYLDLGILATEYGEGTGVAPPIPEPLGLPLLAVGAAALIRRRRVP